MNERIKVILFVLGVVLFLSLVFDFLDGLERDNQTKDTFVVAVPMPDVFVVQEAELFYKNGTIRKSRADIFTSKEKRATYYLNVSGLNEMNVKEVRIWTLPQP